MKVKAVNLAEVSKVHHRRMLMRLRDKGGLATTRVIAAEIGRTVAGTSLGMKALEQRGFVERVSGSEGDILWKLIVCLIRQKF